MQQMIALDIAINTVTVVTVQEHTFFPSLLSLIYLFTLFFFAIASAVLHVHQKVGRVHVRACVGR